MKIDAATGKHLDYLVALAKGWVIYPDDSIEQGSIWHTNPATAPFGGIIPAADWNPSTNWALAGPIIETEKIQLTPMNHENTQYGWAAAYKAHDEYHDQAYSLHRMRGLTPLNAAMRCFVVSKLGKEYEIPENCRNL